MKWPRVIRERFDSVALRCAELVREQAQLVTAIARLESEVNSERSAKRQLLIHCRQLEIKLHDATEPPCSAEDLQATLRRLAVLQTENAQLKQGGQTAADTLKAPEAMPEKPWHHGPNGAS